ncbi:MAG TPA: extracellular solute-binding protein [Phycisphaerales bacterium]|nr:extracellular solute-binding protein [Phycisphaerales bacterium]
MLSRVLIALAFLIVLGVPLALKVASPAASVPEGARSIVVVTPHVPQIRSEFGEAFDAWHRKHYGEPAHIDWRTPGGTTEILKVLSAQYAAKGKEVIEEIRKKEPQRLLAKDLSLDNDIPLRSMPFDMMFGGGTFDHGRLKIPSTAGVTFNPFTNRGVEEVLLSKVSKSQSVADLMQARNLELQLMAGEVAFTARIPAEAFVDGVSVVQKFDEPDTQTIKTRIDLSKVMRDAPLRMSMPAGLSDDDLRTKWFPADAKGRQNIIGSQQLYDPQQYWIGTALSAFGIVYNRDIFREQGLAEPKGFADLTHPKLQGLLILADPRQSGSITTAIDAILNAELWNTAQREGWFDELSAAFDKEAKDRTPWERSLSSERMQSVDAAFARAWKLLQEMSANARTYTAAATKPPVDISAGEGAAGLAIDFYGRGQAQFVLAEGQDPATARVGYVDPEGAAYIDADPASVLRSGPDPELARRFIEFCLTDEAQVLWQLPSDRNPLSKDNPIGENGEKMGPRRYELRRMPVREAMYRHPAANNFIDKVNPFEIAAAHRPANWRAAIGVMMGAFSIDVTDDQRAAWRAICNARADTTFPKETLTKMEAAFYAFPSTPTKDGKELAFTASNFRAIRDTWRNPQTQARLEIAYTNFFRENYREVVRLSKSARK